MFGIFYMLLSMASDGILATSFIIESIFILFFATSFRLLQARSERKQKREAHSVNNIEDDKW